MRQRPDEPLRLGQRDTKQSYPSAFSKIDHANRPVLDEHASSGVDHDNEIVCEGHRELIIETFGADHFPIF